MKRKNLSNSTHGSAKNVDLQRLVRQFDLLSWEEQCRAAKAVEVGDEWFNRKSGIKATVTGKSSRKITLNREHGRTTTIQSHYFASDYVPLKAIDR